MQPTLLMNFAERHRKWLYLAILLLVPLTTILIASTQAHAASGISSLFGNADWNRNPSYYRDNVSSDRCSYLAMCRWGNVLALPSASSLISVNPLMFLGTISSLIFVCVAFFAALVLQFILFLTNASFLSSLSYFVDGIFANFINVISQGRPVASASGVFGNASLMIIVVCMLLAFLTFTYIATVIRGAPGFGRRLGIGIFSITALMVLSYQAQANHPETASGPRSPISYAGSASQSVGQINANKINVNGTQVGSAAVNAGDPKSWAIASPGWFLAWGGQASTLATDLITATLDTVKKGAGLIGNTNSSIVGQNGINDQCGQYIQNMHGILLKNGGAGTVLGNSNQIAVSYDDLLISFILNPYVISKYGAPSSSMANTYCRDLENRALSTPGSQVYIMSETDMYGVKSGFLRSAGDPQASWRALVNNNLDWTRDYRTIKADGGMVDPNSDGGKDDGNGGKYWTDSEYVAARAFAPNLADVAGGGKGAPYDGEGKKTKDADIKSAGVNTARETANKYWFAACNWNSSSQQMDQNAEWNNVVKSKFFFEPKDGDTETIFKKGDAGCHSSAIIGDTFNAKWPANSSGYFADTFNFKEPDNWLDGISKALFGRSNPSVAVGAFSNAPGGTAGPAATLYLNSNGFDPSSSLPFTVMALVLTISSFKFIMPLFLGSFISQAIAILALCLTPILLLVSGFGFQYVRVLARKVLGMIITAFLTFAVLVGVIQAAAALAEVFRKVLYSSWHPVLFQVLEMGLAGILAMQAVKIFANSALNIKTSNMRDAIGSAVGFSTGQQSIGQIFKRPSDSMGKTSSGALGKISKAASATRSTIQEGAKSAIMGKVFGRNEDGTTKAPQGKVENFVNGLINPKKTAEVDADGNPIAPKKKTKETVGEKLNEAGHIGATLPGGQSTATDPSINGPTPVEKVKELSPEQIEKQAQKSKTPGFMAPEGAKGLKGVDAFNDMTSKILKGAESGGFDKETSLQERHMTQALNSNFRPIDPNLMTEDQKTAFGSNLLDSAVDNNQGERVAFGSQKKTQDAYLADPVTGLMLPKHLVGTGTPLSGDTNQNGVTIDGAVRGSNGIWSVQKFVDPTSPAMGVLQGPAPEGFENKQGWAEAGDLHQWMATQGIDAANMDTSKWPTERVTQLQNFRQNADSIYTALGSDLPSFTEADMIKNASKTPGFQAVEVPMDAFEMAPPTDSRSVFTDMNRELAALSSGHDAKIAQIVKDKTASIIANRKARFEQEASEVAARFDTQMQTEEAKIGKNAYIEQMNAMFDHAKESGASDSDLAGLKSYASSLENSVDQSGSTESASLAIRQLADAFKNSKTGDASAIQRLAEGMTDKVQAVRSRYVEARDRQISNLESSFRSDIDGIQEKVRREAEQETQLMYDSVMNRAKEEAFAGNKGTKTRKQAIVNWFPSLFESGKGKE